jgi:hypothetical protein
LPFSTCRSAAKPAVPAEGFLDVRIGADAHVVESRMLGDRAAVVERDVGRQPVAQRSGHPGEEEDGAGDVVVEVAWVGAADEPPGVVREGNPIGKGRLAPVRHVPPVGREGEREQGLGLGLPLVEDLLEGLDPGEEGPAFLDEAVGVGACAGAASVVAAWRCAWNGIRRMAARTDVRGPEDSGAGGGRRAVGRVGRLRGRRGWGTVRSVPHVIS